MSQTVIAVDAAPSGPPLILTCNKRLRSEDIANLRRSWEEVWRGDYTGPAPRILILDAGLSLFQLVEGQWKEVAGAECCTLTSPPLDGPPCRDFPDEQAQPV